MTVGQAHIVRDGTGVDQALIELILDEKRTQELHKLWREFDLIADYLLPLIPKAGISTSGFLGVSGATGTPTVSERELVVQKPRFVAADLDHGASGNDPLPVRTVEDCHNPPEP